MDEISIRPAELIADFHDEEHKEVTTAEDWLLWSE